MRKTNINYSQDGELYIKAKAMLIKTGNISVPDLQRNLKIGYTTAYRLLDLFAEDGLTTTPNGVDPKVTLKK